MTYYILRKSLQFGWIYIVDEHEEMQEALYLLGEYVSSDLSAEFCIKSNPSQELLEDWNND